MNLFTKLGQFASSPQGRRLINQAKEFANDPKRRQQAKDAYEKFRQGRDGKRPGDGPAGGGSTSPNAPR